MIIINHRISRFSENDIYKLEELSKKGIKNFEIDLQLCQDDIVIYHNFTLENLGIFKNLEDIPYNNLKEKGISNLDNLFIVLQKLDPLNIFLDLKGYDNKLIHLLLPKIQSISMHNIYLQSFNLNFIYLIKEYRLFKDKNWKIGFLIAGFIPNITYDVDYIAIESCYYPLLKNINLPIYLYTVNGKDELINIDTPRRYIY